MSNQLGLGYTYYTSSDIDVFLGWVLGGQEQT